MLQDHQVSPDTGADEIFCNLSYLFYIPHVYV